MIALRETGGDRVEAALLLDQACRAARLALDSAHTWQQVERVAATLQAVHTIDGDDLHRLVGTTPTAQW